MNQRLTLRTLLATLSLSLGLAVTAQAMPRGDHHGMGMQAQHAMFQGRAMSRLHDELKLDAKQEAQWKATEQFVQEQHTAGRERFQKNHAELKAMLDQPGADLRAVAKRMDDLRADGMKQREAVRERWLAFYDSLNGEQKEKARLFFKSGMERMERMGDRAKERRGRGPAARDLPANSATPAAKN